MGVGGLERRHVFSKHDTQIKKKGKTLGKRSLTSKSVLDHFPEAGRRNRRGRGGAEEVMTGPVFTDKLAKTLTGEAKRPEGARCHVTHSNQTPRANGQRSSQESCRGGLSQKANEIEGEGGVVEEVRVEGPMTRGRGRGWRER